MAVMGRVGDAGEAKWGYARKDCNAWDCGWCGPKKAAVLRRGIVEAATQHGLDKFLTLTMDPAKVVGVEDLVGYIRTAWGKFRTYLKRQLKVSVKFIEVMEAQKSGVPHLHVLLDRYVEQGWISEKWDALGGGKIVWIEKVTELDEVVRYLAKYLTKAMPASWGRGIRRYSTSRGISLVPKRESKGWKPAPAGIDELRRVAGDAATEVVVDSWNRVKSFKSVGQVKSNKAFGGRLVYSGRDVGKDVGSEVQRRDDGTASAAIDGAGGTSGGAGAAS